MKKLFLLGTIVLLLTGCKTIQNMSLVEIIDESLTSNVKITNVNRLGFSYYLPRGLTVKESKYFNEIITDHKYLYYLYVDVVSYDNNKTFTYNNNADAYYSQELTYNDKKGYIEINNYENDKYLIEIMYNYAKIEVVVYEDDINVCLAYAISILSSITYNDSVITNYLGEDVLESLEEDFDIFEIIGSDNYLQFTEDTEEDNTIKDPDYVN